LSSLITIYVFTFERTIYKMALCPRVAWSTVYRFAINAIKEVNTSINCRDYCYFVVVVSFVLMLLPCDVWVRVR